jgi:hypothetical protein
MPAVAETSKPSPERSSLAEGEVSYAEQLADLEATAAAASERVQAARSALRTHREDAAREVAADLIEYRDAIEAKKPSATPEADRPARERELTDAFLDAIRERGLVLMPVGAGTELLVLDPTLTPEYDAALAAQIKANQEVKRFKVLCAEQLDEERRKADADRIKGALAGDDGDAIREALSPSADDESGAFTTRDLPGVGRVHRRRQPV